uniref:START domain-containing protein n=1 Tax=Chaetoceros debilis TaxID=122233 RepID=A0A7S3PYH9_9STRA|mmetsp:Transcript_3352/g.4732  ORF Transcript_3352/g.4732 Transcript_3352/m.4732 type:complete len:408 (-) Transcript_3352:153-1376(-)
MSSILRTSVPTYRWAALASTAIQRKIKGQNNVGIVTTRYTSEEIANFDYNISQCKDWVNDSLRTHPFVGLVKKAANYYDYAGGLLNQHQEAQNDQHVREEAMVQNEVDCRKIEYYESVADDVEKWSHGLLFEEEGEVNGWKEVKCHKMIRDKMNPNGNTTCYVKWLKDSRGNDASQVDEDKDREYPCIKCYSTFDAPFEEVCEYLSQETHMSDYNHLVVDHRDLENITPHSKITWSQCPQILFVKPRDFVTFCHHRWREDGSQIVVSQACEHVDAPGKSNESDEHACRAYSLRGANIISRDPTDPQNKTRLTILAHAHVGGVPQWACKMVINAISPIEPFRLFNTMENEIMKYGRSKLDQTKRQTLSSFQHQPETKSLPAGLSQLGYACFWPKGGGKITRKSTLRAD